MACTAWCSTVKITDTDGDRLCTALEVWTNRCGEYTELIFVSRLYTDHCVGTEHIRTYI